MRSPYTSWEYGILPSHRSLILDLTFLAKWARNLLINRSFQKSLLQSDLLMTLFRNMSLYHLKSVNFLQYKLFRISKLLSWKRRGSPTKCFAML
ncbi:hypothetical protein R3W88_033064 [Solanum pinnatisectum]|uniref:Uncharacterized protein n=1 Tax=Solanum pinnatisectum TaxID=50273 RepID=A0AAV9K494_9SOLN|nr:hypothetical protein R3W88_033064 [Solanum pinnatisectum]